MFTFFIHSFPFFLIFSPYISSTITYLDNGVLFLGSKISDSLIIRLQDSPSPSPFQFLPSPFISVEEVMGDEEEEKEREEVFFEVLDCFSSLSPVLDMCLIGSSSPSPSSSSSSPPSSPEKKEREEKEEEEAEEEEEGDQGKLVVCCGGVGSGSIREVRSGVTILPQVSLRERGGWIVYFYLFIFLLLFTRRD